MSEAEKQETQKTVVAFITGLLIGGLLVWVFSSTPEDKEVTKETGTNTEEVAKGNTKIETATKTETVATSVAEGDGSIEVKEQEAGNVVVLGKTELPSKKGWIVVRDYMDGIAGNVLGAARYNADEGLMPTSVDLVRQTVAGSSYQVVFYTDEGGIGFKLGEDKLVDGIATTFKAK